MDVRIPRLQLNAQGLRVAPHTAAATMADNHANAPHTWQNYLGTQSLTLRVYPFLFNGTGWDRARNNVYATAIASGTYNATQTSPALATYNARRLIVWCKITSVPGTDTVDFQIQLREPVTGSVKTIASTGAQSALATLLLAVGPGVGASPTGYTDAQDSPIGPSFRIQVVHSAGTDFVYGVYYQLCN